MVESRMQIRVRYAETDQMGYVHHGIYPQYYEIGRTEQLRDRGFSYKEMESRGVILPLHSLNIVYHKPVKYDELLTIKTIMPKKPGVKLLFNYEIYNERNELVNSAVSELIFVDAISRKPMRPPAFFNDLYPEFTDQR